jgi:hypothetical protein
MATKANNKANNKANDNGAITDEAITGAGTALATQQDQQYEILDQELMREFGKEFADLASEIEMGFSNMLKPSELAKSGREFYVTNGATTEFRDKRSGEIELKQVFQLSFPTGEFGVVMQSDANIRAKYARLFTAARMIRQPVVIGPMRYVERGQPVAGNMPVIFEQLPGFKIIKGSEVPAEFFTERAAAGA